MLNRFLIVFNTPNERGACTGTGDRFAWILKKFFFFLRTLHFSPTALTLGLFDLFAARDILTERQSKHCKISCMTNYRALRILRDAQSGGFHAPGAHRTIIIFHRQREFLRSIISVRAWTPPLDTACSRTPRYWLLSEIRVSSEKITRAETTPTSPAWNPLPPFHPPMTAGWPVGWVGGIHFHA